MRNNRIRCQVLTQLENIFFETETLINTKSVANLHLIIVQIMLTFGMNLIGKCNQFEI